MKSKLILTVGLILFGITVFAQSPASNVKIGYTNVDFIVTKLPQYSQIESEIKSFSNQLQKQLESKVQTLRNLEQEIRQGEGTMAQTVYEDKVQEYQNQAASIEKFRQNADSELQKKQMQLLDPVYQKIEQAIKDVATDNGYTHILSDGAGAFNILLYARDEDDITNQVLAKLGVTDTTAEKK